MAVGFKAFGTAAGAELFEGLNAPLEIPAEAAIAELPVPREMPTDIAAELKRLQKQIDELQAASDAASGGEKAALKADRLSTVEKSVGKLVDANDKQKKEDAKKPSFVFSGQVQADEVWFGQDAASRADVGDLQDGVQFRRLRIGARGTSFEVLEYSLGVDFALANQPSYLDNYLEWKQLPYLQTSGPATTSSPSRSNASRRTATTRSWSGHWSTRSPPREIWG